MDKRDAQLHWDLSCFAYGDEPSARKKVEKAGLNFTRFYDGPSTQGFACSDGRRLMLSFRGSDDHPIDWIRNVQFKPVRGELGGHVHSGHRLALDEVWHDVDADVRSRDLPVTVTGHSLGAALATLTAARLHELGIAVEAVFTFGQPRLGRSDFTSEYRERLSDITYRFVCHIDLVTRVPFLLLGYRHVGRLMYFDAGGNLVEDASPWRVARDDVLYRLKHLGRISGIGLDPHLIPSYRDRMDRLG